MISMVALALGAAMLLRVMDVDLELAAVLRRLLAPYRYQARRSIVAQRQRERTERHAVEQALDRVWAGGIAELAARRRQTYGWV